MSKPRENFNANKADIERLWEIHTKVGGGGVGRKRDVEVLNRSAIVFITASWEAYVEDVATEAFDFLLNEATNCRQIPVKVRLLASRELKQSANEESVWDLADGGWRSVLQRHRAAVIRKWVSSLNTPKSKQVDELFKELIGLADLHSKWSWQAMSAEKAQRKLDNYIAVRGQIAHRVKHTVKVDKSWGTDYLAHIQHLVEKTDEAAATHLVSLVGKRPW